MGENSLNPQIPLGDLST